MARAYYASRISDNLGKTPEGYLVATDAVLARTGWQKYKVKDLPQQKAQDLGVDVSNPEAEIDLYRTPEEVFAPETIASFEGKPITDNHPQGFVTADNHAALAQGHTQNVRKGTEALESGDWPLVGDIVITGPELIRKVIDHNLRQLSCGYDFGIERDGDRILQVGIVGNHVALVKRARAGDEARINDSAESESSAPAEQEKQESQTEIPVERRKPVAAFKGNVLTRILGLGFKQFAMDAEPEAIAEAAKAIKDSEDDPGKTSPEAINPQEGDFKKKVGDRRSDDHGRADDRRSDDHGRADDRKSDDHGKADDHLCADCMAARDKAAAKDRKSDDRKADDKGKDKAKADDKQADDHRTRMHAALDKMLESLPVEREAEDVDLEELRNLLGEYFTEEMQEPEHEGEGGGEGEEEGAGDAEHSEVLEPVGEFKKEEEHMVPANDSLALLEPVIAKTRDTNVRRAYDSAPVEDEKEFLMALRPAVARSKDQNVRRAFDAAIKKFTRTSRAGTGSYEGFAGASRTGASDRGRGMDSLGPKQQDWSALEQAYADRCAKKTSQGGR